MNNGKKNPNALDIRDYTEIIWANSTIYTWVWIYLVDFNILIH